ncbi:hypothetical protein GCM10025868_31260 [Angustibacter aerolatus]|uniref:Uncharacterized protein n=1 Tax=Angustibacter aerolatus TaxID=1162965 RepID=A0ABQ6JMD2_9ACTN|nr:hypothetical protein GCM10025868_31260 [Angustibacter aerolatus]
MLGLLLRDAVHPARGQGHVVDDPQVREQVVGLEHDADAGPDGVGVDPRVADVVSVELDHAVVEGLEQVDAPQQRRLARPRRADQRHALVRRDVEVEAVEHHVRPVRLAQAAHAQQRARHGTPPRPASPAAVRPGR